MRIWSIILTGTGLTLGAATPVLASGAAPPVMGKSLAARPAMHQPVRSGTTITRWGPRHNGRWYAGWYAPGGWAAYRQPAAGDRLPRYWISPAYYIGNYGAYGLPVPASGHGWSRYYDDAVLTDRDGRVRDVRSGVAWDGPPPSAMPYDDDVTAHDGPPQDAAPPRHYEGRWTGTWHDKDGRAYSGEYEGRFEGEVRGRPGADYDAPPYAAAPHWTSPPPAPGQPVVTTTQAPGYFADGYYYPGVTTTTVVIQPAIKTTRTYVTERVVRPKVRSK